MMRYFFMVLCLSWSLGAMANEARPLTDDPVLEARLMNLSKDLRCLVCQNDSLASSHADLAEDLRQEIRQQMRAGKTDQQVVDYLVARYGDFVRYNPPVKPSTYFLWYGPFLFMLGGLLTLWFFLRKRSLQTEVPNLSPELQKKAQDLLRNNT